MPKVVLLLRMISFAALFISLSLGVLAHQKSPRTWLKYLLLYMGIEAVYSISFTFVFYSHIYLSEEPTSPSFFFIVFQLVSSAAVVYFAPRFVLELTAPAVEVGNGRLKKRQFHRRLYKAILVPPVLLTAGSIMVILPDTLHPLFKVVAEHNRILSGIFYLYLLLCFVYAFIHRRDLPSRRWTREVRLFIGAAVLFHLSWSVDVIFFDMQFPAKVPLRLILLTNALYEIVWAALVALPAVMEIRSGDSVPSVESLPEEFIREYGLSEREKEVLPLLCKGLSSKDIGEQLYISPRTVENHVHRIYRKCGVKRRLELAQLVNRYS